MNERDKELAMQAGDYVNKVYTPPVRSKTQGKIWEDGHVGWHTQFNAKFADLIRADEREACAKICDEKVGAEYATGKVDHNEMGWTQSCAIDIRARGTHD